MGAGFGGVYAFKKLHKIFHGNKNIELIISGSETSVDKKIIEEIKHTTEDVTSLTKFKKLTLKRKRVADTINLGKIDKNTARYLFNYLLWKIKKKF